MMESKKNEKYDLERRRPLFFGIGMTVALSLTLVAFEWKSPIDPISMFEPEETFVDPTIYIPPTIITPPPPPPPKAVVVVETSKEEEVTEDIPIIDMGTNEEESFEVILPEDDIPVEVPDEAIRDMVEFMPSFKGGIGEFYKYLGERIRYPMQAQRIGVEGKVFVQFVVEKDGSLSDIHVVKGIGAGCDEEAVRVMNTVPNFVPGKQGDIRVRVRMIVPINFTLH